MNTRTLQAIEIAKDSVPLKEACLHYGVEFGRNGFARCPFHSERTASFTIHNNKGHCFGCGWSGDLIDFVQKITGCTHITQTLLQIQRDFMLPLNLTEKPTLSEHYRMSMRFKAIKDKRETENKAQQEWAAKYCLYYDCFALMDLWRLQYAPTSPSEEFDPRYVEAVKYYDIYKYLLEQQEASECRKN